MDDWQDRAFSHKRLPHRSKRGEAQAFDVRKAFGAYSITSNAVDRAGAAATVFRSFEIHSLDETGGAIVGSFSGTGTTAGVALLTGHRKLLERLVAECEAAESDGQDSEADEAAAGEEEAAEASSRSDDSDGSDEDVDNDSETGVLASDRQENARFRAFEKNSFRRPKFWMRWKAPVQRPTDGRTVVESNVAYVVFARNDCKTFTGTLTSDVLGWKDVAIAGRKTTAKARECPLSWNEVKVAEVGEEPEGEAVHGSTSDHDLHDPSTTLGETSTSTV